MFGLIKKFRDGLAKTVAAIAGTTRALFGGRRIDASSLEELEEALITADFGVETTGEILSEIKEAYRKDPELKGKQARSSAPPSSVACSRAAPAPPNSAAAPMARPPSS